MLTDIDRIIIPENRQRRDFDPKTLEHLKKSIMEKGLFHPIVLRADEQTLVAGERRLRAMTELHQNGSVFMCQGKEVPPNQIPYTTIGTLSAWEIEEAELEENTIRVDLKWQEKAAAIDRLFNLRQTQSAAFEPEGVSAYTATDLLEEVTGNRTGTQSVRDSLVLAKHLHIPEVNNATNQKEAVKILKKIKDKEQRATLAQAVDLTGCQHSVLHDDMSKALPLLPANTFDLLLTDPPYGIGANKFGSMSDMQHSYEDSQEHAEALWDTLATESFRLCKEEAHAYVFCDFNLFSKLAFRFELAGWVVWPRPLIWVKTNGMLPRPDHGPRYTYECILFANKGNKRTLCIKPDTLQYSQDHLLKHAAQKPVDLLYDLIGRSVLPGSKILDPFAGSGSTIEAGDAAQCSVTAIDKEPENFHLCLERVAAINASLLNT